MDLWMSINYIHFPDGSGGGVSEGGGPGGVASKRAAEVK